MGTLTLDQRVLLDRLYNLKGFDSTILTQIKKSIEQNQIANKKLTDEARSLETQKGAKTELRKTLDSQYVRILSDLKGISRESYSTVLVEAHEEFDPEAMLTRLQEKIPARLEEIDDQIETLESDIAATKKQIGETEIKATELDGRLSDALQTQERLIKLIEETLRGNGSITRDSVQELLATLGFETEETVELGKMILFPQGTLAEYDREYQEKQSRGGKSMQEVFENAFAAETKKSDFKKVSRPIEVVAEEPVVVETPPAPVETPVVEEIPPAIEEIKEEPVELIEEKKDDFFETSGLDPKFLKSEAIDELRSIENPELIKNNLGLLKALEINDDIIRTYYSLLVDPELSKKIKFFQDINKTAKDIELNIEILLVYSYQDLEALKSACQEYEIDMSIIPLSGLKLGLANFLANLEYLTSKGVELDKGEIRKFNATLFIDPKTFRNNFDLIAKYQYGLSKKNGKTAIQALAQDSQELVTGIDTIIEYGAEGLITSNPEIMGSDLQEKANRVAYCMQNGIPILTENGTYHQFLLDDAEFHRVFQGVDYQSVLPTPEESYENVLEITSNSPVVSMLSSIDYDKVYSSGRHLEDENTYFELKSYTDTIAATGKTKDHSYEIEGINISKERVERNLLQILAGKAEENGTSREEILAVALLYGSLLPKDKMEKVVASMNFSTPKVGGMQL